MKTKITELFGIKYPIISGGMVWCSSWRLAAAVSGAGGLGLIGAGSMHVDNLRHHIECCRATGLIFGVNVPIFYPQIEEVINLLIELKVPIVFTSGGSPSLYTSRLKAAGIIVAHVVSSTAFAIKAAAAGVDAIVCEGFEAGGHNGRDETTTMVLTPAVAAAVAVPIIAAGGIATGAQVAAAFALGASGVQVGTRFALCAESSASELFKTAARGAAEGATKLALRKLTPVRLLNNEFYKTVAAAEDRGAAADELAEILGSRRAKAGIFEGDLVNGELEIGQAASLVTAPESAAEVVEDIIEKFEQCRTKLANLNL